MNAPRESDGAPNPGAPYVREQPGAPYVREQPGAPYVRELRAFFDAVARRLRVRAALQAAGVGLWTSAALLIISGALIDRIAISLVITAVVAFGVMMMTARSRSRNLADVERRAPECRNLLITAGEILENARVPAYVHARVLADASQLTRRLDLRTLLPHRRSLAVLASGIIAWSTTVLLAGDGNASSPVTSQPSSDRAAAISSIGVEVLPPDYTGLAAQSLRDPSRIDALAGSRVRLTIDADAAALSLETLRGVQAVEATGARTFNTALVADGDGFIAITARSKTDEPGARRVIALVVTADARPQVRVTAPGKDLLLASGEQTVPLTLEADDDLALASLELRYTKVSGSGETFTFTEGTLPLAITRPDDRSWTAQTAWRLGSLGLQAGDMVIYRGAATDRRTGALPGESESYVIEIAAPGALAAEGFAVDDRMDKYAISQQMVILKTERLLANRASMPAAAFNEEALDLAAEQRQVRAEFVFMLGGELTDAGIDLTTLNEEAEAAGEEDLAAGRLVNQGRADLIRAIRFMSRAAARLTEPDVQAALPIEKQALVYLQRAFSRSRYILRTLSERERIDLSRRLTGTLAALARPSRPAAEQAPSPRLISLRRILADLVTLAADPVGNTDAGVSRAATLAQRLLEIDATSKPLRDIAAQLSPASSAGITVRLQTAAISLAEAIRSEMSLAPERTSDPETAALAGALADALDRRSRR